MSFFEHRFASTDLSGHPFHPRPGDDPASLSSAENQQSPDSSLSEITPAAAARQANLVCLADIEPRAIDWLRKDRLAAGALAVLSGEPGSGKTWIALAIAAAFSRGCEPAAPSGSSCIKPCTCLYASTGNGSAELLRPRFTCLDGEPTHLILLRGALAAGSAQSAFIDHTGSFSWIGPSKLAPDQLMSDRPPKSLMGAGKSKDLAILVKQRT